MALARCPDCGKEVSSSAPACPHCGRPIVAKKSAGCVGTGCAVFIVLALIGLVFGGIADSNKNSAERAAQAAADSLSRLEFDARYTCQEFVKKRLRAPSTAKFSEVRAWQVKDKPGHWSAAGQVDAHNAFGAMIRNPFGCDMRLDGDNWHLLNLFMP
jgi:hypothetical protein